MDIIKLFVDNADNIEINIKGTIDEPLFQANQIGELLGLKNIRESIRDFDDSQKVVILTDTQGGNQNVIYLTETGLYRFLGMLRKEKAKKFQIWIATVIKEIRLKDKYELEKSLKDSLNNKEIYKGYKKRLKELLLKHFKENIDYSFARTSESKKEGRGGSTKEIILLTIKCFKLLCLKAGTKKANEIHEYFIKLEELLQDIILEECNDIKLQLENKDKEYEIKLKKEKQLERHLTLIETLKETSGVYVGKIKNVDDDKILIKIGSTINIKDRIISLKNIFINQQ